MSNDATNDIWQLGDDTLELTVSDRKLLHEFKKGAEKYDRDYPVVRNNEALVDGITKICRKITRRHIIPQYIVIYIMEKGNVSQDPNDAQHMFIIYNNLDSGDDNRTFAISLVYRPTSEIESESVISERDVRWSRDNLSNSMHPKRTEYYIGFVYMICESSPGFDEEPLPEYELTGEQLLALGVDGELPPELIDISLAPEQQETDATNVLTTDDGMQLMFETEDEQPQYDEQDLLPPWDIPEDDSGYASQLSGQGGQQHRQQQPSGRQQIGGKSKQQRGRSITSAVDEERQRELEQQQLFDDLFASDGEDDTNGSAGYVHNTRDTSELDEAENEYNDLLVDYEELFDFDE